MDLKPHQQDRGKKGVYDTRNKVNDLTGKEWLFSSRSVKTKSYDFTIDIEAAIQHGFLDFMPVGLINDLYRTFSKPDSIIVDPYCNFGSSAIASQLIFENKTFFGFNFNKSTLIKNIERFDIKNKVNISYEGSSNRIPHIDLVFSELIFSKNTPVAAGSLRSYTVRSRLIWVPNLVRLPMATLPV